jgi:glutamate dehydrogenase
MANSKLSSMAVAPYLKPIIQLVNKDDHVENKELFTHFIILFYRSLPKDYAITERDALHWYDLAKSQWWFMAKRKPKEIKLRVFNPDVDRDGFDGDYTLIELDMQDMPFLVDSMRMCLQSLNIPILHMVYVGGLFIGRNAEDQMTRVKGHSFKAKLQKNELEYFEAPIQIQVERQVDPKVMAAIEVALRKTVDDVIVVNQDWPAMSAHAQALVEIFKEPIKGVDASDERESRAFLQWLLKDHFTFLGLREYRLIKTDKKEGLELIPNSGLGVLRDTSHANQFRSFDALSEAARSLATSPMPCIELGKTNTKATVHRPVYSDYIGVKRYKDGKVVGFCRIIGLYTSLAYRALPENVPFVRRKIKNILQKSGYGPASHPGKDLLHILHTFPRDDLFHASSSELYDIALGIMDLHERRCIRLFPRVDRFGRFVSCLVFVPRESFTADLAEKMRYIITQAFQATEVLMDTYFSSSVLVRIHFVVRLSQRFDRNFDFTTLERSLVDTGLSWSDNLLKVLMDEYSTDESHRICKIYEQSFSAAYRDRFNPLQASGDIKELRSLNDYNPLGVYFYRGVTKCEGDICLKLYRHSRPLILSDVVPLLEHMGFTVLGEDSYRVQQERHDDYWISDFSLASNNRDHNWNIDEINERCGPALLKTWSGKLDSDGFNHLLLTAALTWKDILVLRAYAKYLQQLSVAFTQNAIERALYENSSITRQLVDFFTTRFDPGYQGDRLATCEAIEEKIYSELEHVKSLDHDRIIRLYVRVMQATLRTNHYLPADDAKPLAFKIKTSLIPDVPKPVPAYEIFVYCARFEGVHLRAEKVARGGFRWSDRYDDYRTEVLGLMKAQQVKNSVIVPAGAKGGFVTKRVHPSMPKDEILAEGMTCYQNFIRNLLDMVDNIADDGEVIHKPMVRYDDDDFYLVVAADKGTATFSDLANAISKEYKFWLGDAFASGGSVGYDHKKMGITARGAWVSAQRHFMDMGQNVDNDPITVVGIGDMSGDVFGNGLLMSKHMKLLAAFNHIHIFIDPNPDSEKSFAERKRLFELPRSTWEDYNKGLISKGGGVFNRDAKSITLPKEAQKALGLTQSTIVPDDLIRAILKANVDMLWNGGIGTYIKAPKETNEQVGDRNNDLIRVNGNELRCKVVCEGGNLGATQLGRISFALNGGCINTDFIDNSGGVDCSDHEVNIKILLNQLVQSGQMSQEERDKLLNEMEPEVARLVLINNYRQNQTLSNMSSKSLSHLSLYMAFMKQLDSSGILDRSLMGLPTTKELLARKANNQGLTKPELAILLSTAKNILKDQILDSPLVNDPALHDFIYEAFPMVLKQRYPKEVLNHQLHKDILATQISNTLISDMGIAFVYQMMQETDAPLQSIVKAYVAARSIYDTSELYLDVASLDYMVAPQIQNEILVAGMRLVRQAVRWFLAQKNVEDFDIAKMVMLYRESVITLFSRVEKLLVGKDLEVFEERKQKFIDAGVPEELTQRVVSSWSLYHALNIVQASITSGVGVYRVAKAYFLIFDRLHFEQLRSAINRYPSTNRWSVLAKAAFNADLDSIQRAIVVNVLMKSSLEGDIKSRIGHWREAHTVILGRYEELVYQLTHSKAHDFAMITVAIRLLKLMTDNFSQPASLT